MDFIHFVMGYHCAVEEKAGALTRHWIITSTYWVNQWQGLIKKIISGVFANLKNEFFPICILQLKFLTQLYFHFAVYVLFIRWSLLCNLSTSYTSTPRLNLVLQTLLSLSLPNLNSAWIVGRLCRLVNWWPWVGALVCLVMFPRLCWFIRMLNTYIYI